MKRLLAAAALAAALSCSAAGTQDIQKHGEEYFRIFSILPDGQGILARRCTKLTRFDCGSKQATIIWVLCPAGANRGALR